jgi:signal transduction histidine kinase
MIWLRHWLGRMWPVLRLRTIMFGLLLVVAALPGVAAIMLRVYENALVRRTEAELIAQGSALAAIASLESAGKDSAPDTPFNEPYDADERAISTSIDLRSSPILPERPDAQPTRAAADADAARTARMMAPVIAQTRHATLAAILLLDRQGVILNGRDAGRSLAALPEVRAALAGRPATVLRHNGAYSRPFPLEWVSRATDIRLHHARPVIVGGQVVGVVLVSRSPRALFRGMYEDRGKIAAGTAAIFLFLLAMTALLGRTIVRPIEALSRATRALTEGRSADPPAPTLRVQEIDSLIRDFATMAAAIEARSHYLRDFAAALAHEFKTPLTGLSGGIELLQDHSDAMSQTERGQLLTNMAGDTERLNRLISRLMELARADMQRVSGGVQCDLRSVLARLADGLSGDGLSVGWASGTDLPDPVIAAPALETVLTTLIDNARAAGAGLVSIDVACDGKAVTIAVTDDGSGISASDRARIFEPFFTSKRESGGTGLGLPIARALIEGNRGSLMLDPTAPATRFVIRLASA